MEETLNICLTCLSTDRCLVPLHKITMLLQEIHLEQLKLFHGGVCWECRSMLVKFYRFKKKANIAQETLSRTTEPFNIKPLTTLTSKTNYIYDYQYTYSLDPLKNCYTKLKAEPETIKQEIIDQSENIDNTSDFGEKTSNFYEEVKIDYDNAIERKHGVLESKIDHTVSDDEDGSIDNTSDLDEKTSDLDQKTSDLDGKTSDLDGKTSDLDGKTSDLDEKLSDIPEKIEKVYVDVIENKHNNIPFKNQQKYSQGDKKVKINIAKVAFREIDEKVSKSTENGRDVKDFQEKFVRVVLSEEDMLRAREVKRNHHNFKKLPYKCDSCVLGFTRKDTYSLHLEKKHNESIGDHICDVCSIRLRHKLALNNHRNKHYVVYRCRLCRYEAHEFMSVDNHCKTKHAADKPDNIHCSQCTVVVKTPDDLEKHMQTKHTLFCDCGIKFKDKNNLRRHMSRAHSVLRNFICDICKKSFKTKMRLETHMVRHSGNIEKKLAYCQRCKVQYKNIQVYRMHLRSSANHSEGYPCSECNKKFRSKGYLKQHYDFYHLRKSQYQCEVCNKLFISNWRLRNHKQLYHGMSRPRNHSCNTCGKKFFTSATLRSHQFTHSDQRSFMCEDCGDTFKQSAALYTHSRLVHKGGAAKKKRDC